MHDGPSDDTIQPGVSGLRTGRATYVTGQGVVYG